MDSRIREIEQWVAKAKEDLGECGQEAYIRKLYLLDAEIRAIIRENGILPGAASPEPQQRRHVRRFTVPALAVSGVLSVLLLAATTVLLTRPVLFSHTPAQPDTTYTVVAGFVPASIDGELILADNGAPLNLSVDYMLVDTTATPVMPGNSILANEPATGLETGGMAQPGAPVASTPITGTILASAAPSQSVANGATSLRPVLQPGEQPTGASQQGSLGIDTVDVMLVANAGQQQPVPVASQPRVNNNGSTPSVGFDGITPQVARLEFNDRFSIPEHQELGLVNSVKTQLDPRGSQPVAGEKPDPQGGHVDKSTEVSVDNVDNQAGTEKNKELAKQGNGAR